MAKRRRGDEPEFIRHGLDGSRAEITAGAESASPALGEDAVVHLPSRLSQRSVRAAVNMKIAGASYQDIASTLEYTSAAQARAVVEQGLADAYDSKDTASLRRITSARLEGLWRMAWKNGQELRPRLDEFGNPIAIYNDEGEVVASEQERNPEQAAYIRLGMDITARYSKLHGLDAPTQVQVSPNAEQFEHAVSLLVAANQQGLTSEADIFAEDIEDAEIVPEEGEL